jgi:diguanylate cyclase (GGDEF)-like protein
MPRPIFKAREPRTGEIALQALKYLLPSIAAIAALLLAYYFEQTRYRRGLLLARQGQIISVIEAAITSDLSRLTSDARLLSGHPALHAFIANPEAGEWNRACRGFLHFARSKPIYDHVRFISTTGREAIRINHSKGTARIVPREELQDKSERYYLRHGADLREGEVFISPLDLNMENEKIERPLKPMIRIILPVFDSNGRRHGMLVFNYKAKTILDDIRRIASSSHGELSLLNAQGYYLLSNEEEDEWGFMLPERRERRFAKHFPAAWECMRRQNTTEPGEVANHSGIFSFSYLLPLQQARHSDPGSASRENSIEGAENISPAHAWIIVLRVSPEKWRAITQPTRHTLYLAASVIIIALAIAAFFGARTRLRRRFLQDADEQTEQLYRQLASHIPNGAVYIYDKDFRLILAEGKEIRDLGAEGHLSEGMFLHELFPAETRDTLLEHVWPALEGNETQFELEIGERALIFHALPIKSSAGEITAGMLMGQDITQRKAMEEKLREAATTDTLTSLYNRRHFMEHLNESVSRAERYGEALSLCICDVDNFKTVNDIYGHQSGDEVLSRFAAHLRKHLRDSDIPARYGGDEFVILFPATKARNAAQSIDRFRAALEEESFESDDGRLFMITGSFGVAEHAAGMSAKALLEAADQALYASKAAGRNQVSIFKPDSNEE